MPIKGAIKSMLRLFGTDIVRFVPELNRPFPVLPFLVREQLARIEPFFFIQVGASDGVLHDPIRELILQHRLAGLLIEPLPDMFVKLKQSYMGHQQLDFENVAISDRDGEKSLFRVKSNANVPYAFHGLASFYREHLLKEGVLEGDLEECKVQTVKFETLLARHKINGVNLLQIDTEGYDFEIIKLAFAAGMRPNIINYEHCHLRLPTRLKCKQFLDAQGYQFLEVGIDTLAVRQD